MQTPSNSRKSTLNGYDLWSENYDQFANPMIAMVDWALSKDPLEVKGLNVLELGCGTGRNLSRLLDLEITSYTGVDGSEGMLQKARSQYQNPNVQWIQADLNLQLPISSESMDIVLVTLVLEHMSSLDFIFSEVHRVLKAGSPFRLLEIHSDLVKSGTQAHFWHQGQEHHLESHSHDIKEFRKSLSTARLEIEKINIWSPPTELIKKLPKLSKHSGHPMIIDISSRKNPPA